MGSMCLGSNNSDVYHNYRAKFGRCPTVVSKKRTHARTHEPTHARTHARKHACTHTRARARVHTYTGALQLYLSIYKVKRAVGCLYVRGGGVRSGGVDRSFSSFLAAFTLTTHINALYNERVYGKEEHAT